MAQAWVLQSDVFQTAVRSCTSPSPQGSRSERVHGGGLEKPWTGAGPSPSSGTSSSVQPRNRGTERPGGEARARGLPAGISQCPLCPIREQRARRPGASRWGSASTVSLDRHCPTSEHLSGSFQQQAKGCHPPFDLVPAARRSGSLGPRRSSGRALLHSPPNEQTPGEARLLGFDSPHPVFLEHEVRVAKRTGSEFRDHCRQGEGDGGPFKVIPGHLPLSGAPRPK